MSPRNFLVWALLGTTAARLFWQFARPLTPGECYLALCGFLPSFAYFDGPGGTPLLVAWGISSAGSGGFGAAFFWPLLAAVASVFAYFLVAALAGPREGLAVAVLLNLLPVFNEAALVPSCAMPLVTAALGASLCAWHALDKNSAGWWAGAGSSAAFGLFFTYTAWFLMPALGLVLLFSHRWRRRLAAPGFWLAWVPPAAVYLLLLRWNNDNGWVHFIGGTWKTAFSVDASRLPSAIVDSALAVTPFVLGAIALGTVFAFGRLRLSPKIKFITVPALAATLAAVYAALRGWPLQTPGLLAATLALPLVAWLPSRLGEARTGIILSVVFLGTAAWTALTLPRPPSATLVDAGVGETVAGLRSEYSDPSAPPLFLVAENAPLASALALALPAGTPAFPGHPPIYTTESPAARSQFDLWPRYDQFVEQGQTAAPEAVDPFTEQDGGNPFMGRTALYITTQTSEMLPQSITAAFAEVQLLGELTAPDGTILRVYLCSDYQTMPL
ncbi:MAG: glycosyltransferase family 39 protein [Chthoniobacterales bacterium]